MEKVVYLRVKLLENKIMKDLEPKVFFTTKEIDPFYNKIHNAFQRDAILSVIDSVHKSALKKELFEKIRAVIRQKNKYLPHHPLFQDK